MTTPQPLQLELVDQGSLVFLRLEGEVDESNQLAERTASLSGRKIVVNAEKVSRINSCGVRDWIVWVQGLEARGNSVHLVRCSPAIVSQVKMVRNFCGAFGHVVSFLAPYYCPTCDSEHEENLLASMIRDSTSAPTAICESCGEPMEFDDLLETYDSIVKAHAGRPIDPEVADAVNRFGDGHLATAVAELHGISTGRISSTPRVTATTPPPGIQRLDPRGTPAPERPPALRADGEDE